MICCDNPLFIGCFGHCTEVSTGIEVQQDGVHRVEVDSMGVRTEYLLDLLVENGDTITFPNNFNEYMLHQFRIVQPDGTYLTDPDTGRDCFTWHNVIQGETITPPV